MARSTMHWLGQAAVLNRTFLVRAPTGSNPEAQWRIAAFCLPWRSVLLLCSHPVIQDLSIKTCTCSLQFKHLDSSAMTTCPFQVLFHASDHPSVVLYLSKTAIPPALGCVGNRRTRTQPIVWCYGLWRQFRQRQSICSQQMVPWYPIFPAMPHSHLSHLSRPLQAAVDGPFRILSRHEGEAMLETGTKQISSVG